MSNESDSDDNFPDYKDNYFFKIPNSKLHDLNKASKKYALYKNFKNIFIVLSTFDKLNLHIKHFILLV